jgi:diguanylate cyclase (GGDEF)-like protein
MTGIASHSIGQQHLRREMSRLQRHRKPFSIVLMTMDHPQDVERIAGHMASQKMLKRIADHIIQNSYLTDTCFRYAINKIMVVLPDTDEGQARSFCRKISRTLMQSALFGALDKRRHVGYSLSAGVVQAQPDSGLEELIAAAEREQAVFYEGRKE